MPKKTRVANQPRIVAGAVVLAAGLWAYGCDDVRTRADAAATISAGPGVEVLFSRGIPGAEEWRR